MAPYLSSGVGEGYPIHPSSLAVLEMLLLGSRRIVCIIKQILEGGPLEEPSGFFGEAENLDGLSALQGNIPL